MQFLYNVFLLTEQKAPLSMSSAYLSSSGKIGFRIFAVYLILPPKDSWQILICMPAAQHNTRKTMVWTLELFILPSFFLNQKLLWRRPSGNDKDRDIHDVPGSNVELHRLVKLAPGLHSLILHVDHFTRTAT